MSILPINDHVLIKPFKEETGGVVEPDTLEGAPEIGIVESIGCKDNHCTGFVAKDIDIGDKVFFDKFLATEVKDKGEKYYLVLYSDIRAIIREDK